MTDATISLLFGGFFALAGALFAGLAIAMYRSEHRAGRQQRTTGKVIANRPQQGSDGTYYASVFRFTGTGGHDVEAETSVVSMPAAYKIGDTVPVVYNPANPEDAQIDTFGQRWFLVGIFGLMGTVFSAIGFAIILFR